MKHVSYNSLEYAISEKKTNSGIFSFRNFLDLEVFLIGHILLRSNSIGINIKYITKNPLEISSFSAVMQFHSLQLEVFHFCKVIATFHTHFLEEYHLKHNQMVTGATQKGNQCNSFKM